MVERVGLGLTTASEPTFASFFVSRNQQAIDLACSGKRVWLWGAADVGKTHILKALQHECTLARFVEETDLVSTPVESTNLLLIDQMDQRVGSRDQEYALFEAFEATDFDTTRWVIAGRTLPTELNFHMSDLGSRMRQFESIQVLDVSESERDELLHFWAKDRQLRLPEETIRFLLPRIGRSQGALWQTLQRLDEAATNESSELTIPFVRSVLGLG